MTYISCFGLLINICRLISSAIREIERIETYLLEDVYLRQPIYVARNILSVYVISSTRFHLPQYHHIDKDSAKLSNYTQFEAKYSINFKCV